MAPTIRGYSSGVNLQPAPSGRVFASNHLARPTLRGRFTRSSQAKGDFCRIADYLCTIGNRHQIYFLWRPYLNDPKDDMVLELAVTAGCRYIVTFNERDFRDIERFGLQAIRPIEFPRIIGDVP
jgi:predicted nucleic acid-binding protein